MVACGAQRGRGSGLVHFEFDGAVDRQDFTGFLPLPFLRTHRLTRQGPAGLGGPAGLEPGWAADPRLPLRFSGPWFRGTGVGKPCDLKALRGQRPGASSLVVPEGVLSPVGRSERGSGSRSELVSLVWPL